MLRILAIVVAFTSPLLFPAPLTFLLIVVASVILPPVGILAGIFTDLLYGTEALGVPYVTLIGLICSVMGYLVRRFIETRIMTV